MRISSRNRLTGICLSAILGAAGATAQPRPAATPNPLTPEYVKTGLYVISGGGANSVLRLTANGLILVDGKLPGNYDYLRRRIKKIADQPVRALVLTGHQENRSGLNANFQAEGARLVVQENTKKRLAESSEPEAAHAVTFDREYDIHLGGVEARLFHFGNARTDGDTVVYFPNLRAIAVGDLYSAMPEPDFQSGGSLVEWSAVLAQVLKLGFDVAIPSQGAPVGRVEIEALKSKIDTLTARAARLVGAGVPKDQLLARMKAGDLGWQLHFADGQLDRFYAELARPAAKN